MTTPSTIPDDTRKALFTLCDADIEAGDVVDVMDDLLSVIKEGDVREIKKLTPRVNTLLKSTRKVQSDIQKAARLLRHKKFVKELKSRKIAAERVAHKRTTIISGVSSKKSEPLRRLENITKNAPASSVVKAPRKRKASKSALWSKQPMKTDWDSILNTLPDPDNGEVYSLREVVTLMRVDQSSSLYGESTWWVYTLLTEKTQKVLLLCNYRTLQRRVKAYEDNKILPAIGDEGIQVGCPPRVSSDRINDLNTDVAVHVGLTEGPGSKLAKKIITIDKKSAESRGVRNVHARAPAKSTEKTYNLIAADEPGITLTLKSSTRAVGARRQMSASSPRNLMNHLCTILDTNFEPGNWDAPRDLPQGCRDMLRILKQVTGINHRPIHPHRVVNFDFSSYYTWEGTAPQDSSRDQWVRVSEESISRGARNALSLYRDEEDVKCNGLTVKWCDATAASGHVFPMVMIFAGMSEAEMPKDSFLPVKVQGLHVNAHIDAGMNQNEGWVCFMRSGASMEEFFEWYENTVLAPTCQSLRQAYNVTEMSEEDLSELNITRVWLDSDMPFIKRLSELPVMEKNMARGLLYNKCGAKYTACGQPKDRDKGFQNKRSKSRHTTLKGRTSPLKNTVELGMSQKKSEGRLILRDRKYYAIVDCVATAPQLQAEAYTQKNSQYGWISAGFLDEETCTCPTLDGIIKASRVNFEKHGPGFRQEFMDQIPGSLVALRNSTQGVPEAHYDSIGFPIDTDDQGNEWPLHGNSAVFGRSMPLYSESQLQKKRAEVLHITSTLQAAQERQLAVARSRMAENTTAERELLGKLGLPLDSDPSTSLNDITYFHLEKLVAPKMEAFVRARKFDNIMESWKVPNKGTAATANNPCNKTKGPLLIKMAFELRNEKPIAKVPELPPVEAPMVVRPPPAVVEFATTMKSELFAATSDYCRRVHASIKSINHQLSNDDLESCLSDMARHNATADMLSRKLLARLPDFVSQRILSPKKAHLLPGKHWTWKSTTSKMRRISTFMVMSGLVGPGLEVKGPLDSLLASPSMFQHAVGDLATLIGCYCVEDGLRQCLIRAGMTFSGFKSRWAGHAVSSTLHSPKDRESQFYNSYPHKDVADGFPNLKGTFQDLHQLVALGFEASKMQEVANLFEWEEYELNELKKLKMPAGCDTLLHRQCKHICYLFETAYGLAIEPSKNISGNPGQEWQLGYFGGEGS